MIQILKICIPIRIDWKCSKCGKDNSVVRFLQGSTREEITNNFIALQDEKDLSRFKFLNIDCKCCCKCGEIEEWNNVYGKEEAEAKARKDASDEIKLATLGSRGVSGGIVWGSIQGVKTLGRMGIAKKREHDIKKLSEDNLPKITKINVKTQIIGMSQSYSLYWFYNSDQAWDLMVFNLCRDNNWSSQDYSAFLRYVYENQIIDKDQYDSLKWELDEAKKEDRSVNFRQFFFESDEEADKFIIENEQIEEPINEEVLNTEKVVKTETEEKADKPWNDMISILCDTELHWDKRQYESYLDIQKAKHVINQEQYDCLMEEVDDAYKMKRPVDMRQFFFEESDSSSNDKVEKAYDSEKKDIIGAKTSNDKGTMINDNGGEISDINVTSDVDSYIKNSLLSANESSDDFDLEIKQNYQFCRKCGKKIPTDSVFCNYCGTKVVKL